MLGGKNQKGFGLIVYAVLALAIVGTLGGIAWKLDRNGYVRGKAEVQALWDSANEAARKREAELSAFAAKALADERKRRKVVVEERTVHVDREVSKVEYRDICLPDRGLCLLRAAIDGKVEPGCFADGAMPAAKPSR